MYKVALMQWYLFIKSVNLTVTGDVVLFIKILEYTRKLNFDTFYRAMLYAIAQ